MHWLEAAGTLGAGAVQFDVLFFTFVFGVVHCPVGYGGLSLYIDERRVVQGNTSMRSKTECWYFPVLPDSSRCTDIIQFLKVVKLQP